MTTAACTKVDRKAFLDALRGLKPDGLKDIQISLSQGVYLGDLKEREVAVGYWKRENVELDALPNFIVIPHNGSRELFAWLATYCDSAAPLSQWCRIFPATFFISLKAVEIPPILGKLAPIWAGISIGESLAQAGGQISPKELTVGAVTSSFSFAVARASALWPSNTVSNEIVHRIEQVSNLLKLPVRRLLPKDLIPIWSIINSLEERNFPGKGQTTQLVWQACLDIFNGSTLQKDTLAELGSFLGNERALFDISVRTAEERIRIFDKVVDYATKLEKNSRTDDMKIIFEFLIAYLAASIGGGGGTTHLELLNPIMQRMPMVSVWYGAISAMYQPEAWGAQYGGLGRLVLRELGYPLRFDEPPRADLSYDELLATVDPELGEDRLSFRGVGVRNVNIELLPGIISSFNLHNRKEVEPSKPAHSILPPAATGKQLEALDIVSSAVTQLEHAMRLLNPKTTDVGTGFGARVQQRSLPGLAVEKETSIAAQRNPSYRSFSKDGKQPKK